MLDRIMQSPQTTLRFLQVRLVDKLENTGGLVNMNFVCKTDLYIYFNSFILSHVILINITLYFINLLMYFKDSLGDFIQQ